MKILRYIILIGFLFTQYAVFAQKKNNATAIENSDSLFIAKIKKLPGVISIEKMIAPKDYQGKYMIMIRQPLDHDDTTKGFFNQRVFLLHKDFDKPMVVTTEGYAADYGNYPFYQNELNYLLDANEILIEHRYFSESVPEPLNWDYLTVEEAAADHHKIITTFKDLYNNKWIATGISKGGQTVLYLVANYPGDVDFAVPYVAPLNFAVEDGRHEPFIRKNGKPKERRAIRRFQKEILKRKDSLMPMFEEYIQSKGLTFRLPPEVIYDYCVLEYSFAFWQWVADISGIPDKNASNEELFKHFKQVSGPEYFDVESGAGIFPFFVQAARELGYYGYETKPFRKYLSIPDAEGYIYEVFLPDSLANIEFIPETNQKVFDFFEKEDPKILLIYGEHDPWSASGVFVKGKENIFKFVKENGHHATRIANMPDEQKEELIAKLKEWLAE